MDNVPQEVFERMLRHLVARDLVSACLVSRRWEQVVTRSLWSRLSVPFRALVAILAPLLTKPEDEVLTISGTIDTLQAQAKQRFYHRAKLIKTVELRDGFASASMQLLQEVSGPHALLPNLKRIEIAITPNCHVTPLVKLLRHSPITSLAVLLRKDCGHMTALLDIYKQHEYIKDLWGCLLKSHFRKTIEDATFEGMLLNGRFPELKRLTGSKLIFGLLFIEKVDTRCPKLEEMTLDVLSYRETVEKRDQPLVLAHLRRLTLRQGILSAGQQLIIDHLSVPSLESTALDYNFREQKPDLRLLSERSPLIREMEFPSIITLNDANLEPLARFQHLKTLKLGFRQIGSSALELNGRFLKAIGHIENLFLTRTSKLGNHEPHSLCSSHFSTSALISIATHCTSLRQLAVPVCTEPHHLNSDIKFGRLRKLLLLSVCGSEEDVPAFASSVANMCPELEGFRLGGTAGEVNDLLLQVGWAISDELHMRKGEAPGRHEFLPISDENMCVFYGAREGSRAQ